MKRNTEFILGLLGGILGLGAAFFALFIGEVDEVASKASYEITGLGYTAFIFSVLAILGSILVRAKAKIGGWLMILSAIGGIVSVSLFYVLPGLLLLIAGGMGAFRREKRDTAVAGE
ncbi:hypothetical protein GCM10007416_29400 [Kroppenstedtia guangzhouensis]|jgi:Protein of unknown function (DUF4064)|uniref:DUF4064 domain-containing protein n=1 Tax=Kroppenstedtia guangzhouensis TaxID=1274356 RepID=A0ABQ1H171_9BACL|nr:DUF4064 domain-containing protein [Kroppenstedtia guangzhouensis]GGA54305.1 hypothetical protein GCM10007416_29400 [Kroppenstedtia guangzhouensis]